MIMKPDNAIMTQKQRKILIIQPLPGVGDMIWHVPHIRAIRRMEGAQAQIYLLTKTRSRADAMFDGDPAVNQILWLDEKAQKNLSRGNIAHLARTLRPYNFDRVYVLHHSPRYTMAAIAAGIPERCSYGFGLQRLFMNCGYALPTDFRRRHPILKATAFIEQFGEKIADRDGLLTPSPALMDVVRQRLANIPRPWLGFGIGSSEAYKQYGAEKLGALARAVALQGWHNLILLGGPPEQDIANYIREQMADMPQVNIISVLDWPLSEVIAVQAQCAAYIGNDTGFLNISAALAVPSWGLFGATEPLFHSSHIIPVVPDQGYCPKDGMNRIDPVWAAGLLGSPGANKAVMR